MLTEVWIAHSSVEKDKMLSHLQLTDEVGVGLAGSCDPVLVRWVSVAEDPTTLFWCSVYPITANTRYIEYGSFLQYIYTQVPLY